MASRYSHLLNGTKTALPGNGDVLLWCRRLSIKSRARRASTCVSHFFSWMGLTPRGNKSFSCLFVFFCILCFLYFVWSFFNLLGQRVNCICSRLTRGSFTGGIYPSMYFWSKTCLAICLRGEWLMTSLFQHGTWQRTLGFWLTSSV